MDDIRYGSLIFDRAAAFYDRTRALPADLVEPVARALIERARLEPGARIYEPGIGTGRMAVPLAARGMRVYGADLSRPMMAQLARNSAGLALPPRACEADIVRPPFAGASFDAAVAVHVFHLVGGWREALAGVRRVLRPGAALFHGQERTDEEDAFGKRFGQHSREWQEAHGLSHMRPGGAPPEVDARLRELGGRVETALVAHAVERATPRSYVEEIAGRIHSHTWRIPEDLFAQYVAEMQRWSAAQTGGNLDAPVETRWRFEWDVWTFA